MQLHSFRRNNAGTEFVCLACHHSSTYCNRFGIKDCPAVNAVAQSKIDPARRMTFSSLLGMPYGKPYDGDPYKRVFGINGSASQTPLDVTRRRVGAVDCTLIETPLREEISRVQGQLIAANAALASSNRAKDLLHKIIGSKREQLNKVLSVNAELRDQQQRRKSPWCHRFASECEGTLKHLAELRSRLSVAEANLLCEQGAYRKIVGLRKDDIASFTKHTNDLKREIEMLKEVVAIERKHAAVLQKQFDMAIKQRDDHRAALTSQQTLARDIISTLLGKQKTQQERVETLETAVRNSRMANVYAPNTTEPMKVDVSAIKDMFAKSGWKSDTPVIVPLSQADGHATAALPQEHCQMQERGGSIVGGPHPTFTAERGRGVTVKKYPGVLWATGEALNAQFKHGASVEQAQAYLDFCEANALTGPYYGYQQWKAIYRAPGSESQRAV